MLFLSSSLSPLLLLRNHLVSLLLLFSTCTFYGGCGCSFCRHLAGEIGKEYSERMLSEESKPVDDLLEMADIIVPIQIRQHSEFEACDLLLEV